MHAMRLIKVTSPLYGVDRKGPPEAALDLGPSSNLQTIVGLATSPRTETRRLPRSGQKHCRL